MKIEKTCKTCYNLYHYKHTNSLCMHALMCHDHDKWRLCTNGDYIRHCLDDEALSAFLCSLTENCDNCPASGDEYECENSKYMIDWLGTPADEDLFG